MIYLRQKQIHRGLGKPRVRAVLIPQRTDCLPQAIERQVDALVHLGLFQLQAVISLLATDNTRVRLRPLQYRRIGREGDFRQHTDFFQPLAFRPDFTDAFEPLIDGRNIIGKLSLFGQRRAPLLPRLFHVSQPLIALLEGGIRPLGPPVGRKAIEVRYYRGKFFRLGGGKLRAGKRRSQQAKQTQANG